mgnify:CR=1 FL=1
MDAELDGELTGEFCLQVKYVHKCIQLLVD